MRRMSRFIGILFLAILLSGLAACQPTSPTTSTPGKASPDAGKTTPATPEGTLRVGLSTWGEGLANPPVARGQDKAQLILLYDWLVGASIDGNDISPDTGIANKWEQSADGLTWTFNLRKGVQFHDGNGEVTADDVKFSLERVMFSPKSKADYASALKASIDKIDVVDPYTVKFAMKKSTLTLAYDLSPVLGSEGIVVSKKYIEKVGEDGFDKHPVGSGPYKFAELLTGSYLKLVASDQHFSIGVPKFTEVYIQYVPEESTRKAMLKTGELDVIDVSQDGVGELEKDYTVAQRIAGLELALYPVAQWQGAMSDKRVRQAIDLAIDREALLRTLYKGKGAVPPGFAPSWAPGPKNLKAHPFDPDKARALLQEAGQSNIELDFPTSAKLSLVSEAIAGQLQKAGFKVKMQRVDDSVIVDKYSRRSATVPNPPQNAVYIQNIDTTIFPHNWYSASFRSDGPYAKMQDPKLDALIDVVRQAQNLDVYAKGVGAVNEYIDQEALALLLVDINTLYGGNPKKVQQWNAGGKTKSDPGLRQLVWRGK